MVCSVGLCTAIDITMLDAHTYNRTVELLGDVRSAKVNLLDIPLDQRIEYVCPQYRPDESQFLGGRTTFRFRLEQSFFSFS